MTARNWMKRAGPRWRVSGAGPTSIVYYASDACTDANSTVITSHTPVAVGSAPAGTGWVATNGAVPALQIQGNRIALFGTPSSARAVLNGGVTPANASYTADLVMYTPVSGQFISFQARCQTGNVEGYFLQYAPNALSPELSTFSLQRGDAAFGQVQIGSNYTFPFPTPGTAVPVEIRCVGGAISAKIDGVTNAISGTDGSPLTGTRAGVCIIPGGVAMTSSTGVHVDNIVVRSPT